MKKKVALVTGAAAGIGQGIARGFLQAGWAVFTTDLQPVTLEGVGFLAGDVGDPLHLSALVAECVSQYGGVDCLVNNAGRMGERKPLAETTLEDWEPILRTNLTGPFLLSRECAPYLERSGGSIVNIASTRATMSEPNTFAYSASKGGLLALTHSLAASLAPVRVNCISPGWISEDKGLTKADHQQHWAGRVGRPQDVAEAVLYLAEAGFITGAEIVLDGGMTRKMIYVD